MDPHSNSEYSVSASDERLDSWKEIAAYLKRDERTLRRWEKGEGLPVHRHVHSRLASVYAYKSELDQWWSSRRPPIGAGPAEPRWRAVVVGGVLLVALGLLATSVALLRRGTALPAPPAPPSRKLLVVLPFENLSGDPEQEYFSDGITDEIISRLGQVNPRRLGVIGRATAMQYKDRNRGIQQIGEELEVDYVLEGSVHRSEGRVRLTVRLVQVRDQALLWSDHFDRHFDDVLSVQDEVALSVARRIQAQLALNTEARLPTRRALHPQAYEDYLKGRHFFNTFTAEGLRTSVEYFQRALAKEPGHPLLQTWLGAAYAVLGNTNVPPRAAWKRARGMIDRALQNDPSLPEAHAQLGFLLMLQNADWRAAEKAFQTALELDPNSVLAHHGYAVWLVTQGRMDEGLTEIEHARRIDPLSLIVNADKGWLLFHARRYAEAEAQLKKTLELDPGFPAAHVFLGFNYAQTGRHAEAFRESLWFGHLIGADEKRAALLRVLEEEGARAAHRSRLRVLQEASKNTYVPAYWLVGAHLSLGETEEAMVALEKAYVEGHWMLVYLKVDPRMDPLRGDPRFQKLLQRIGLN